MGFVRLNRALNELRKVMLDTTFILEYMPLAPENYVKVYLTGLAFSSTDDNDLEGIALALDMDKKAVMDAFNYWQRQEVVNVSENPPSVEYLPVLPISKRTPKYDPSKYKSFNDQLHAMIHDRPITQNEYKEYYDIMEHFGVEIEAMLTVIAYCIRLKGTDVRPQYIYKTARNLAEQGYRTYDRVQERLSEFDLFDPDLKAVLKSLKLTRSPDYTDKQFLLKWKKEAGFPQETIIHVAKRVTKGGMQTLDTLLGRYYENRIFTVKEIDAFEARRGALYDLTREILKILGLRFERHDYIVETYISPWLSMGFTEQALKLIADYCFRKSEKSLERMNFWVQRFYKQGLVSGESIHGFLQESLSENEKIHAVLEKLGLSRPVYAHDRDQYKTWLREWKTPEELIDYACGLSRDKANPMAYMNAVLAGWYDKKITTVAEAKAQNPAPAAAATARADSGTNNPATVTRNLTAEELNAMFERLEDDEL